MKIILVKFFEIFFLCREGCAKLIDKHHSNRNLPHWVTALHGDIIFLQKSEDPDWIVHKFYLFLIAVVTEANCEVENLWKRDKSKGRTFTLTLRSMCVGTILKHSCALLYAVM